MDDATVVTRNVDLELSEEDVWYLVGDGNGWAEWMVDEADVVVEPGAEGTVTDADIERGVRVTEVVEGERVSFVWWPSGDEDATSAVELVVGSTTGGAVLRIVETFPAPRRIAATRAATTWAIRVSCLRACSRMLVAA